MNCNLCPRKCNIDRKADTGWCKTADELKIAKIMLHKWEEPPICTGQGSGAIFFSGCNLKCVYCYEEGCIVKSMDRETVNNVIDFICKRCKDNKRIKTLNITWFGGEPLLAVDNIIMIGEAVSKYCSQNGITFTSNLITPFGYGGIFSTQNESIRYNSLLFTPSSYIGK